MFKLNKLNLILLGIIVFTSGYLLGGLTISYFYLALTSLLAFITQNEVLTSVIVVIFGWFITSYLDRKISQEQFVNDKKFKIAEILLASLSKYSTQIGESTRIISALQLNYNIPTLNSQYKGEMILSDIFMKWNDNRSTYIEFLQNFENYEVILAKIQPLIDKFKQKTKLINEFFVNNYLFSEKDFKDFQSNPRLQEDLIKLLDETMKLVFDQQAYIYDVRVGIQNILLSNIFSNKVQLREPATDMEVLT